MRKALALGFVCAAAVFAAPMRGRAQSGNPDAKIFGGYSFLRLDTGTGLNGSGWEASIVGNFNRFCGVEANFGDHYDRPALNNGYSNDISFLFGPHVTFRGPAKVNPFAHFLVGGTRGAASQTEAISCPVACPIGGPCSCPTITNMDHTTAFTTAVGGGLDVKAANHVWFRVFQADYVREYFPSNTQNDARISFGVVMRTGR